MNREINIRLNANRAKAIHTGHKFASGDKGIVFRIAVDELNTMGTTAKIVFKRSNGTSVEAEITEGEGFYSYTTLGNEFAVVGPVTADVKFYDENENRVSTCTFLFDVTADTLDGLGVGTAGYSDTLERMKKSMEQAEADMLAAKAELEKQAEEILQQMEKTAENAEGDIEETEKKMADLSADLEALYQEYMAAFGNVSPFNPRGPYSETETYTVRDMVSHNDASWICYRNCTGATPGEGSDCWQKLSVEAEVDPEDFLKKTDVDTELNEESKNPIANKAVAEALENVDAKKLDGHKAEYFLRKEIIMLPYETDLNNVTETGVYFCNSYATNYVNTPPENAHNGILEVCFYSDARIYQRYYSITNNGAYKRDYDGDSWSDWAKDFTTAGGTIAGDLSIAKHNNGSTKFMKNHSASADYGTRIYDISADGKQAGFGWSAKSKTPYFIDSDGKESDLLHTGNKPTGTYTGNGESGSRTISVGGIGGVLAISTDTTLAIVGNGGFIAVDGSTGTITGGGNAFYANGNLYCSTSHGAINASGKSYTYQVL